MRNARTKKGKKEYPENTIISECLDILTMINVEAHATHCRVARIIIIIIIKLM